MRDISHNHIINTFCFLLTVTLTHFVYPKNSPPACKGNGFLLSTRNSFPFRGINGALANPIWVKKIAHKRSALLKKGECVFTQAMPKNKPVFFLNGPNKERMPNP